MNEKIRTEQKRLEKEFKNCSLDYKITSDFFRSKYFKYLSQTIRAKTKHGCLFCRTKDDLVVHHLNEIKQDNRIENLAVLCRSCHGWIHSIKLMEACL